MPPFTLNSQFNLINKPYLFFLSLPLFEDVTELIERDLRLLQEKNIRKQKKKGRKVESKEKYKINL